MTNYLAFLRLDYYTIREYLRLRNLLIYLALLIFLSWSSDTMILPALCCLSIFFAGYPFAIAERDRLDFLYASLPLSRRQLVTGRYLFCLVLVFAFLLIALIFQLGLEPGLIFSMHELLPPLLGSFFAVTAVLLIQLPFLFRLPYTKARLVSMLPLVLIFCGATLMNLADKSTDIAGALHGALNTLVQHPGRAMAVLILAWVLLLALSLHLSQRFYAQREF